MKITLTIELTPDRGALVRALGLVERRGYRLLGVQSNGDERTRSAVLDVDAGDRSPDLLARQLERLLDVRSVLLEVV